MPGLIQYRNVSPIIGAVLSTNRASLRDLDEHYSIEDVYDLLEVAAVDAYNMRVVNRLNEEN